MDADTLISILFVGVIILFQLFGTVFGRLLKQGKSAKGEKAAKAGGLLKTLTERINREIQIAMEQAAKAQQRPSVADEGKQPGRGSKKAGTRPPARPPQPIRARAAESRPGQKGTTRFEAVDKKPARPARRDVEPKEADLIDELRQGLLQAATVAPETPVTM